jgi:hypothetical protein
MFNPYMMMLGSMMNFKSERIARVEPEENQGIGVSTVYTSDEGYETALLDATGAHPVERYTSKVKALKGHKKWVKDAPNLKTVIKLGSSFIGVESEEIELIKVSERKNK